MVVLVLKNKQAIALPKAQNITADTGICKARNMKESVVDAGFETGATG